MKIIKLLTIFLSAFIVFLLALILFIYFNIGLILNVDRLKYALDRFDIFKSYSWESALVEWRNEGLLTKVLKIDFKNFCFDYQRDDLEVKGCFSKIYFETQLSLKPPFIFHFTPLIAESELMEIVKKDGTIESSSEVGSNIDIKSYYGYLWNSYLPDLNLTFHKIDFKSSAQSVSFPLSMDKTSEKLMAISYPFNLQAQSKGLQVYIEEDLKIPFQNYQLALKKAILSLDIDKNIAISFFSVLEFVELNLSSTIPSIINTQEIEEVVAIFINNFKLSLQATQVQDHLSKILKAPYNSLPAPLNEMDGDIHFDFSFSHLTDFDYQGTGELKVNFKSENQLLDLSLLPQVKVSAKDLSYSDIMVNLVFNKVLIELPRFSKRSLPPQLIPDSRFKKSADKKEDKKKDDLLLVDLNIKGEEETSLHLKTDLIDEVVRLNFHFEVKDSEFEGGYVRLLPLSLKILKRPIRVDRLWLTFSKVAAAAVNSIIVFNLPEYKIKLVLEGPLESPRYAFTSEPPLPQSDIYSVLLFGRPLQDMGGDNTALAQQTSQLVSQGLLSLTVLYILSGTPIEYIGYDPNSKQATAQVGLGHKNSLRVSSGEEGRTTGVRRSLGGGWYLDTSVQSPSSSSHQRNQDYGLFLERIISY